MFQFENLLIKKGLLFITMLFICNFTAIGCFLMYNLSFVQVKGKTKSIKIIVNK